MICDGNEWKMDGRLLLSNQCLTLYRNWELDHHDKNRRSFPLCKKSTFIFNWRASFIPVCVSGHSIIGSNFEHGFKLKQNTNLSTPKWQTDARTHRSFWYDWALPEFLGSLSLMTICLFNSRDKRFFLDFFLSLGMLNVLALVNCTLYTFHQFHYLLKWFFFWC